MFCFMNEIGVRMGHINVDKNTTISSKIHTLCQKLETDVTYFFIFTKQVNISVCLF